MKRSLFANRHPYWFVALMELLVIAVYLLAGTAAHFMHLSNLELYGMANLGLTVLAAVLLTIMGWWKAVGFKAPEKPGDLVYFLLPFLPIFINLIPGVKVTGLGMLAENFAITLMVGFVEEVFFRGLMLNALKAQGFWKAAVITALLFGLTHSMNLLAGKSLWEDLAQVLYAVAFGFAFAALVLKKGILWPLIVAHFLIDFFSFSQDPSFAFSPFWTIVIVAGITVLFTAYGLFLMLDKRIEKAVQPA